MQARFRIHDQSHSRSTLHLDPVANLPFPAPIAAGPSPAIHHFASANNPAKILTRLCEIHHNPPRLSASHICTLIRNFDSGLLTESQLTAELAILQISRDDAFRLHSSLSSA